MHNHFVAIYDVIYSFRAHFHLARMYVIVLLQYIHNKEHYNTYAHNIIATSMHEYIIPKYLHVYINACMQMDQACSSNTIKVHTHSFTQSRFHFQDKLTGVHKTPMTYT